MFETSKDEVYLQDLRSALQEYDKLTREIAKLSEERQRHSKMVKSLIAVLRLQYGESVTKDLLERYGILEMASPFLSVHPQTAGSRTVIRRRRGQTEEVDTANIVPKGSRIRMLVGRYRGQEGVIASYQARPGKKGRLDVTYFIALELPDGRKPRTSVKHSTLNKSWGVVS